MGITKRDKSSRVNLKKEMDTEKKKIIDEIRGSLDRIECDTILFTRPIQVSLARNGKTCRYYIKSIKYEPSCGVCVRFKPTHEKYRLLPAEYLPNDFLAKISDIIISKFQKAWGIEYDRKTI